MVWCLSVCGCICVCVHVCVCMCVCVCVCEERFWCSNSGNVNFFSTLLLRHVTPFGLIIPLLLWPVCQHFCCVHMCYVYSHHYHAHVLTDPSFGRRLPHLSIWIPNALTCISQR